MTEAAVVVRVTHVADAVDALGLNGGAGSGGLAWLGRPGAMAIGRAFTLQQRIVTALAPGAPAPKTRHGEAAQQLAQPGDILVIAIDGALDTATWGEAHALRALARGLGGVLTDGATRDIDGLRERGFPMLCRGASPFRSTGRLETLGIECDVTLHGVRIRHGDTIVMDADGFMCLPAERAAAVLAQAEVIARKEQVRDEALLAALPAAVLR